MSFVMRLILAVVDLVKGWRHRSRPEPLEQDEADAVDQANGI